MFSTAPHLLGPEFQVFDTPIVVNTTVGVILNPNPDRWGFYVYPNNTVAIWFGPSINVAVQAGIQIIGSGNPYFFKYNDWGPLVANQWYGIAATGPLNTFVTEVLYVPKGY